MCAEIGKPVRITIETRLPMQRGLGGVLRPKKGGYSDVHCENAETCQESGRDCIWAVGSMKSTRDPLKLNIPL